MVGRIIKFPRLVPIIKIIFLPIYLFLLKDTDNQEFWKLEWEALCGNSNVLVKTRQPERFWQLFRIKVTKKCCVIFTIVTQANQLSRRTLLQITFVVAVLTPAKNLVRVQINICADGWMSAGGRLRHLPAQINSNHFKIWKYKTKIKNVFVF